MSVTDKLNPNSGRVVVVGPVIADQYYIGQSSRLDQTAAVPIVDVPRKGIVSGFGGGANAARCISHLAIPVALVSAVGVDAAGKAFASNPDAMIQYYVHAHPEFHTPTKHRIYSEGKLIARFDVENPDQPRVEDYVIDMFRKCVGDAKPLAILISDYNKGICTDMVCEEVLRYGRQNNVKVIVDPSTARPAAEYTTAHIITPNEAEVLALAGHTSVHHAGTQLCGQHQIGTCVITRGGKGLLISQEESCEEIPAIPAMALDTCGCGDMVAAVLTYGTAVNMDRRAMYQMAVTAGAVAAEIGGATPVPLHKIHRRISTVFGLGAKHVAAEYAMLLRISVALTSENFVVTNGVFDVMHPGHVSMLEQARKEGDFLLVLVNTDEAATRIKRKPAWNQGQRLVQLAALPCVDAVMLFNEDTPAELISWLLPDVLVKGPELKGREASIPGAKEVMEAGGRVATTTLEYDLHASDIRKAQEAAPPGKKLMRQLRLSAALSELDILTSELLFERIVLKISDGDQHWQFFYGGQHIADYWPASGKGQVVGDLKSVDCGSVAQAQKLAVNAKKRLFERISSAWRGVRASSEPAPHEAP